MTAVDSALSTEDQPLVTANNAEGWHYVKGWPVERMPGCATCGAKAIGLWDDGGPRYPTTCIHPPIYPRKP